MKHNQQFFYSQLIEVESIIIELDKMDLSADEKLHLTQLIDSSLHHAILDAVFSELSDQDKRMLVNHLNKGDHEKIWSFLQGRIENVEDKIKKVADDLKKELHQDMREKIRK